jgi:ABC-2 type transport system ATP-binding protein
MIEVEHLTKRYGSRTAVDDLSFSVADGEIVGFLGPNGAGKSTTMRILACFLPPSGGRVCVDGLDVVRDSLEVRRRVGYMPESVPLYPEMRVREYIGYRARLKGVRGRRLGSRMDEVLALCGLQEAAGRIIGQLSKGFRQRVGLADALIHEPRLLILDEPSIGLDPNQIRDFRQLIRGLAHRHTVLLSSHILPEVETICQRVLIINRGRIVASDTPDQLAGMMLGHSSVVVELKAPEAEARAALSALNGVIAVQSTPVGHWVRFTCECGADADPREEVGELAHRHGWPVRELSTRRQNLEDVFVAMTTRQEAA